MNKSHPGVQKGSSKLFGFHRSTLPTIPKNLLEKNELNAEQQTGSEQNFDTICDLINQVKLSRGKYIPDYMLKSSQQLKLSNNSNVSPVLSSHLPSNSLQKSLSINSYFSSPPSLNEDSLHLSMHEPKKESNSNELPIQKLYNLLNQNHISSRFPEKVLLLIIEMIKRNLLLPVPEVPKQYVYCDQIAQLTLQNWPELEYLHKIVFILINEVDNSVFSTFLKSDFIRSLFSILNSPDHKEQSSIESMITLITEKYPETLEKVYNESLSRIVHHIHDDIEGKTTYFCVSSCLKFILNYFKQPISNVTSPEIFEFKIFPLFSSYFLSEFYQNLNVICTMFYGLFDNLSSSSLRYLLSHWPETHTSKQIVYVRHISVIVQDMSSEKLKQFLKPLLKRFEKCLHSSNFKIIAAALQDITNPSFLFQFSSFSEKVISSLYPSLSNLIDYWHPDVRNKIEPAIDFLSQMNPSYFESLTKKNSFHRKNILDENLMKSESIQKEWGEVAALATKTIGKDAIAKFNKKLTELKKIDIIELELIDAKCENNETVGSENDKINDKIKKSQKETAPNKNVEEK